MSEPARRPTAAAVIGYGAIVVGLLGLASGLVTAFDSEPIFEHQVLIGLGEVALSVLLAAAGRALLRLRMWGAVAIQVFAILGLLFFITFGTLFALLALNTGGPQVTRMVVAGVGIAVFYAVPLLMVSRSLAAIRRRGVLS